MRDKDDVNPSPVPRYDPGKTYVVKGDTLNKLAAKALPVRAGDGLKEFSTPHGKVISALPQKRFISPFEPTIRKQGEAWQISFAPGFFIERTPHADDCFIYHDVTNHRDGDDPVWHTIALGQAAYVKASVPKNGKISTPPEIIIGSNSETGAHYKPDIFIFDGIDGEHWHKLVAVEDDGNGQPKIVIYHAGDHIYHIDERLTWKNREQPSGVTGDRYIVGHEYVSADDEAWLKFLLQVDGDGHPIIKPPGEGEDMESMHYIPIRRIKQRDSQPQIRVSAEPTDGAIKIHGNDKDGALFHQSCDPNIPATKLIEWQDGLVITAGNVTFTAGCGTTATGTPP